MKRLEWNKIKCLVCGGDFLVMPYRALTAKSCSVQCRQRLNGSMNAGDKMRGTGEGKTYTKFHGRHLHRNVAEELIGRPLVKGEVVHHIDGNKFNNLPSNLMVTTQSAHLKMHHAEMMASRKIKKGY